MKSNLKVPTSPTGSDRLLCCRCLRPQSTCYCESVRPIQSRFQFVLLQHPLEFRNGIGTARMAHHCLANSKLIVGVEFENHPQVLEILKDPKNECVVLFPGPHSVNLSNESLPETQKRFRSDKNWVIFVIDGTWFLAKKMLKRNPTITSLPQICFTPKVASQYRIRLQPHPYCLSTIEAVHHLISLLEPEINPDNLLEVFCGMVNRQLSYFAPSSK